MAEYRERYAELQSAGVQVAALSADTAEASAALHQEEKLPFTLLCDPDKEAITRWDLLNSKERGGIAYPAVFVLGSDLKVRYRSLDDTASRVHADGLLEFLKAGSPSDGKGPKKRGYLPHPGDFIRALRNFFGMGKRSPQG